MRRPPPPEYPDEWIKTPEGYVPYRYLERLAICEHDGRMTSEEAHRVASEDLQREAIGGRPRR